MKKVTLFIVLLGFIFSDAQAQSIYLDIGAGFSKMSPMSNQSFLYSSDPTRWQVEIEEMTGKKSDLGFNVVSHIQFRLSTLPLSLSTGISYTQLYGGADFVKVQSPPWYNTMYTTGELETRKNILSIRPGVQWAIIPSPITAFLSLELLYNILGETKLKIKNSYGTTEGIIEGNTRMGLSFGCGVRVNLVSPLEVSIGTNYSLNNLILRDDQEEAKNTFSITTCFHCKFL